ncbi:unnamed protein product [Cyclocybe aegerita]|uniref:NACHT domain-containing protein n=1 Tax=Cyclocybe aegerita TaxID=1973307 RepID=A0A8S0W8Z5_CYCAE|nr:unnamed protein product [Cyclocybe aegerita]
MTIRIDQNPTLFALQMARQMEEILLKPLNSFPHVVFYHCKCIFQRQQPRLILIDGLDECFDNDVQEEVIRVMAELVYKSRLPNPTLRQVLPLVRRKDISADPGAAQDIRDFLDAEFAEIRRIHSHTSLDSWPSREDIEKLVQKSSGQFIYASAAMNYIKTWEHRPDERLQVILGLSPQHTNERPFAELDKLYHHILISSPRFSATMRIVSILAIPRKVQKGFENYATPAMLERLLSLGNGDVQRDLSAVRSIFSVHGRNDPIVMFHASLPDFLCDPLRSKECFVDPKAALRSLAEGYLNCMSRLKTGTINEESHIRSVMESLVLPSVWCCKRAGLGEQWLTVTADLNFNDSICSIYLSILERSPWTAHSLERGVEKLVAHLREMDPKAGDKLHSQFSGIINEYWSLASLRNYPIWTRMPGSDFSTDDIMILVMGISGSGKSPFLNNALYQPIFPVHHGSSPSHNIQHAQIDLPLGGSTPQRVWWKDHRLIRPNIQIYLEQETKCWPGHQKKPISMGILLMHPIHTSDTTDNRHALSIEMILNANGQSELLAQWLVVTTMWDAAPSLEFAQSQQEQLVRFCNRRTPPVEVVGHNDSHGSAWRGLNMLLDRIKPSNQEAH